MTKLTIIDDGKRGQFWEIRNIDVLIQGQITGGRWFVIDRVVHLDGNVCGRTDHVASRDLEGRAHLGVCHV